MTNEELIEHGLAASALLNNPTFTGVMNTLSDFHLSAMLACSPEDRKQMETRDHHFIMLKSLQEITETLVSQVQAGREIQKRLAATEEDEEI